MSLLNSSRLKLYLIPGMSAGPESFESIRLPGYCSIEVVPWLVPRREELLVDYAKRMLALVDSRTPFILLGVSFGGIIAQEALKFLTPQSVILISTVKSNAEKPAWMHWVYRMKVHKILPYYIAGKLSRRPLHVLPNRWQKRWRQYDYYLPMRDPEYLSWGVDQVLKWNGVNPAVDVPIVHIHGDADHLFPIKYIKGAQIVKGGPHIMILTHGKAVSKLLARILDAL